MSDEPSIFNGSLADADQQLVNPPDDDTPTKNQPAGTYTQWAMGPNGKFNPVGATVKLIPPGVYEPYAQPGEWGLQSMTISSDGIYDLPDMATEEVLREVKKFWESERSYRAHNLLYKRGLILHGPPGGGKTVTVKLLMNALVKRGGIVLIIRNVNLAVQALKAIRVIEPERHLIVVMEDIDEIINYNGEAAVLSMLDGENNIDNVLNLATTNYPEILGARIINRPSRFDRRIAVGMPEPNARRAYIVKATHNGLSEADLDLWVKDTETMSIAHLRELVAAVYCLDEPYADVIERLKDMAKHVDEAPGFAKGKVGFSSRRNN